MVTKEMERTRTMIPYVESKIPLDEHKYNGWFYHYPTKKFYRWNDLPWEIKEEDGDS